jgi:hypothetical protein
MTPWGDVGPGHRGGLRTSRPWSRTCQGNRTFSPWASSGSPTLGSRVGHLVGYARIAHLSAPRVTSPRVTSTVTRPAPSGRPLPGMVNRQSRDRRGGSVETEPTAAKYLPDQDFSAGGGGHASLVHRQDNRHAPERLELGVAGAGHAGDRRVLTGRVTPKTAAHLGVGRPPRAPTAARRGAGSPVSKTPAR